jgi:type VI secretion system protein ImpH
MRSLRKRDAVPDFAKLHYAGHLSTHCRNADSLAQILAEFFKVPVVIEEFVGHWMRLPVDSLCRLRTGHEAQVLGMTTILGTKVWNCQHKFRIVIGPVTLTDYRRLLPGGDSFKRLVDWVRNYIGLAYDWDVNLVLKKEELPPLRLGGEGCLGWSSWLHSGLPLQDLRQVVLNPTQYSK